MVLSQKEIKKNIQTLLENEKFIIAAWEGGSTATGYADAYSDLDLMIICEDDQIESVFIILNDYLQEHFGILRKFRLPEPTWHGMSQCFYLTKGVSEFFYFDIAVIAKSNPNKFTEPDRHGNANLWFDKTGIFCAIETPVAQKNKLAHKVYNNAVQADFITLIELNKSLRRRSWVHSHMNYITFLNRHLIPLLNIRYRTAKADFGIRYIDRDYPRQEAEFIENMLKTDSIEALENNWKLVKVKYDKLKAELAKEYAD